MVPTPSRTSQKRDYIRLVKSFIALANEPTSGSSQAKTRHFEWAMALSKERSKKWSVKIPSGQMPISITGKNSVRFNEHEIYRGWLYAIAVAEKIGAKSAGTSLLTAKIPEIYEGIRKIFRPTLEKFSIVQKCHFNEHGIAENVEIPMWTDVTACSCHAFFLLLTDYQGIRSRFRVCPYAEGDAFWLVQQPIRNDEEFLEVIREPTIHFFLDDRYIKGKKMKYCCPKHQEAASSRRHRMRQKLAAQELEERT